MKRIHSAQPTKSNKRRRRQRALRAERLERREVLTLTITEVNYNPYAPTEEELAMDANIDSDDFEFIELKNIGDDDLDITEFQISTAVTFDFAGAAIDELEPGEFVIVVANQPRFEIRYGQGLPIAGTFSGSLKNSNEQIILSDANGTVLDFEYDDSGDWPGRADGGGSSLEVRDIAGDYTDGDNFRSSIDVFGSPGRDGTTTRPSVVINEVLAHTDFPLVDHVELHNFSGEPIDISHWWLSDDGADFFKYQVPAGREAIAGGGYTLFTEAQFNLSAGVDPDDFAFDGARGDDVWLISGDENGPLLFVDRAEFQASLNGVSHGRWPNATGDFFPLTARTLGFENAEPRVGPMVISEIMYNAPDPGNGFDPEVFEYVEIFNPSAQNVSLNNWYLNDGVSFQFPDGTLMAPRELLVVLSFDPADPANSDMLAAFRNLYSISSEVRLLGPYDGGLSNGGETVWLSSADMPPMEDPDLYPRIMRDFVEYNDRDPWPLSPDGDGDALVRDSATAFGNDATSWLGRLPNPGSIAIARDDVYDEIDGPATLNVLDNDGLDAVARMDLDVVGVGVPNHGGQVMIAANGQSISYTPAGGFIGTENFTYTVSDGTGGQSQARVALVVTSTQNVAPVANEDSFTVAEDAISDVLDVLVNDSDADGDTLTIIDVEQQSAVGGSVAIAGTEIEYTPPVDYFGTDSFEYTISDGNGNSATGTVTVTVTAVNDAPSAEDDAVSVLQDSQDNELDLLSNDTTVPDMGESLVFVAATPTAQGGTVQLANGGAALQYSPAAGFVGEDNFEYTVSDGNGGTATASVTVTVSDVNDPPTAVDDVLTVLEDTTQDLDVLANDDIAPDQGETLSVLSVTPGTAGGQVIVGSSGSDVEYTPPLNFNGEETFTYTITDGRGGTDVATVVVNVTPINDPPSAADDTFNSDEDSTVVLHVLANDTWAPDAMEDLTLVAVEGTDQGGSVSITPDGFVEYTPAADFFGEETFQYTVSDGQLSSTATVTVVLANTNDPPTPVNDVTGVFEDAPAATLDVLGNDSSAPDPPETLTVVSHTDAANGQVVLLQGTLTYEPDNDFNGSDQFDYTISDGNGATATATVLISVVPTNDPPVANDDTATVAEDSGMLLAVLDNDNSGVDAPETLMVLSVGTPSAGGTASVADGVSVQYDPAPDFFGEEDLVYTITDGNGGTATGTLTITVTPVNDPPTAVDDSTVVDQNSADNEVQPLLNDSSLPDGPEDLFVTAVGASVQGGSVILIDDQRIQYTPPTDFVGIDEFTYTISDGTQETSTATVRVSVVASNAPWQNPMEQYDVDGNGIVVPLDALLILNDLNENGTRDLPAPAADSFPPPYVDVDGNGRIELRDALNVINYLNEFVFRVQPDVDPTAQSARSILVNDVSTAGQPLNSQTLHDLWDTRDEDERRRQQRPIESELDEEDVYGLLAADKLRNDT